MSDPGAHPWWADVQHLRPAADREREQRARDTRDAALQDVRATAQDARGGDGARTADTARTAETAARALGRVAGALGSVATLERTATRGAAPAHGDVTAARDRVPAPRGRFTSDPAFDDKLASWLDQAPPAREREIQLVVEEPVPDEPARRRRDRLTTDDWLALTAPPERRDPATGRRTIEIRGQADGLRGVARPDGTPAGTRAAAGAPDGRRRPARSSVERMYGRPDRVAMWAFVLGVVLILVALIGTPEASAATRLGDRVLKVGMEGRDVRHLQLRLTRGGFLDAPADARFGALEKRAVRGYQRSRCLTADGIAGPATIRALRAGRRPCRRAGRGGRRASASRTAYRRVHLGTRTLARGMRGRDVRTLQRLLGLRSDGVFGTQTKRAVRRFQRGARLGVDGAVGPATRRALVARRMRVRKATWYGPGLFGRRTACGQRLTRRLAGVAHRTLPCGTAVLLHYGGRFVTARVVDRGPYANGASLDLTAATARRIGLRGTARLRARW